MDNDRDFIKLTTSEFIDAIISDDGGFRGLNKSERIKKYKNLVNTQLEKAIWNHFEPDDKFEDATFSASDYADSVFNRYVPSSGHSNCGYGEYIRAINKIFYRYYNDGDNIVWGPYSALLTFISQQFDGKRFYFSDIGYVSIEMYEYSNDQMIIDRKLDNFNCLISALADIHGFCPDMLFGKYITSQHISDSRKWVNWFVTMIDQLQDDWKGVEKKDNIHSCDNYYKNALEYRNSDIYEFLDKNFNLHNWASSDWAQEDCDRFTDEDENMELVIKYGNTFVLTYNVRSFESGIHLSNSITASVQDSDIEKIEEFLQTFKKYDTNKNVFNKLTFDEFLKFGMTNTANKEILPVSLVCVKYCDDTKSYTPTGRTIDINLLRNENVDYYRNMFYVIKSNIDDYHTKPEDYKIQVELINPPEDEVAECDKMTLAEAYSKIQQLIKEHNLTYCNYNDSDFKLPTLRILFDPFKSNWRKYHQKYDEEKKTYVDDINKPIVYTKLGCTYECSMSSKYWFPDCIGSGLYAFSMDKNDPDSFGIKLSNYLDDWVISYCYFKK